MNRIYDNPKYNAAFERCIDVMAKLMQKYGNQVLEKQEQKAPVSSPKQLEKKKNRIIDNAA